MFSTKNKRKNSLHARYSTAGTGYFHCYEALLVRFKYLVLNPSCLLKIEVRPMDFVVANLSDKNDHQFDTLTF